MISEDEWVLTVFFVFFSLHNANTVSGLTCKQEGCCYARQDIFQIKILHEYATQWCCWCCYHEVKWSTCSDICTAFKKDKCIGAVLKGCSILQESSTSKPGVYSMRYRIFFFTLKNFFPHPHCLRPTQTFISRCCSVCCYLQGVFCLCTGVDSSFTAWQPSMCTGQTYTVRAFSTPCQCFPLPLQKLIWHWDSLLWLCCSKEWHVLYLCW